MKNKILFFFMVLIICIFPTYIKAEENVTYSNLSIVSVITTSADMSEIENISIECKIINNEKSSKEQITLNRNENFSKEIPVELTDVEYIYGVAITKTGLVDKYGFVSIKGSKSYDIEKNSIILELKISFNDMGFDGKNYRKNIDISDEYIEERIDGVAIQDSKVLTTTTTNKYTTTTFTDSITKRIITEQTTKTNKTEDKSNDGKSQKILEYIVIIALILVGIVSIIVLIKYNNTKKMV